MLRLTFAVIATTALLAAQPRTDRVDPIRTMGHRTEVTPDHGRTWRAVDLPDDVQVTVAASDELNSLVGTAQGFVIFAGDELATTYLGNCRVTTIERSDDAWLAKCGEQSFLSADNGRTWSENIANATAVSCNALSVVDYTYFPLPASGAESFFRVRFGAASCRPSIGTPTKSFLAVTRIVSAGVNTFDVYYRAAANSSGNWRLADVTLTGQNHRHRVIQRGTQPAGTCSVQFPPVGFPRGGNAQNAVFGGTVNTQVVTEILSGADWLVVSTAQGNTDMTGWPFVFRAAPNNTGRARTAIVRVNGYRIEGSGVGDCHVNMTVYQN